MESLVDYIAYAMFVALMIYATVVTVENKSIKKIHDANLETIDADWRAAMRSKELTHLRELYKCDKDKLEVHDCFKETP